MASIHDYQWWITDAPSLIFTEERGRLYIGYIPGINFMYSGAVDLLQIRYAIIFAWFCPCSIGWFRPIFLFSLLDINLTLGLLPPRRHVVCCDSVGVGSSRSGLKSECTDIFHQSFLCCYTILTSPKEGETAVYGYNPALFWLLSVSCWCLAELIFT